MFTEEQKAALAAPLQREHVKDRPQAGRKLFYIEGWHAIAEANRIFGFDGWTRQTVDAHCVAERERKIGSADKPERQRDGWGVSYLAKVRVTVGEIVREGIGAGHGIDVDLGLAHESAIKESETDGMKRALVTFGNPFGLALYDKAQENVERGTPNPSPPGAVTTRVSSQASRMDADELTMTERLVAAQETLETAAQKGVDDLRVAYSALPADLKPPLERRAIKLAELAPQYHRDDPRRGTTTITSGREAHG